MSGPAEKMVEITIDGRAVTATEGSPLLDAACAAGIEIPTLCDHPDLEPVGACRLCMVEVTHPDWNGWSGLMTACLYPASAGLEVSTGSPRVIEARRRTLALMAARCPNSGIVRELAGEYGADTTGLLVDPEADDCILCGLCTRVCEAHATEAIATWSRGSSKAIGTFGNLEPEECVGCGGCALVCPTGHIHGERTSDAYKIWGRSFPTSVCVVDVNRCSGCGACEELCPFHVARIGLTVGGGRVAGIPPEHCRGCGVCVGACPAGAITQEGLAFDELLPRLAGPEGRGASVLACGRANLQPGALPGGSRLAPIPCSGRVTAPLLIAALARGSEGILVLGRQQQTCRLDGAEGPAVDALERARDAAELVGLGWERLRFEIPEPGGDGGARASAAFAGALRDLGASPLKDPAPEELLRDEGLDTTLALLAWCDGQPGLVPDPAAWLARHDLPAPRAGGPVLTAGLIPHLETVVGWMLDPVSLPSMLRDALRVLERLGAPGAGIDCGALTAPAVAKRPALSEASAVVALSEADAAALREAGIGATTLETLIAERAGSLPAALGAARVACDGSPVERALLETMGIEPVDAGPDPLPESFTISPQDRAAAESRLQAAERDGAGALLVRDPFSLARWALVTRHGSWRASRIAPATPHQIAALAMSGTAVGFRALRAAARRPGAYPEVPA